MQDNLFNVVNRLILKNNLRINAKELHLQITSHPSYPSLHSVSAVLTHFRIENLALQLPITLDTFEQLPDVFIACIETNEIEELVLVEKKAKGIKVTGKKVERMAIDSFFKAWTGVILVIEKEDNPSFSKDSIWSKMSSTLGWLLLLSALAFTCMAMANQYAQIQFLLSILGTILSIMIVSHELGNHSTITNKLCQVSGKVNCDEVINSKFGQITKHIKISDLSVIYFGTLSLCWLSMLYIGYDYVNILQLITLGSISAIVLSLYYQLKIIKKICSLCLFVALILAIQAIVTLFKIDFNNFWNTEARSILTPALCLIITAYIWSVAKTQLKLRSAYFDLRIDHTKFKRKFTLFNSLHKDQKALNSSETIEGEIVLGNKFAPIHLILITSPLCMHCRDAHHQISNLLAQYSDRIKVSIRINVRPAQVKHDLYKIASILIQIHKENGPFKCLEALHYLYTPNANIKKWLSENDHLFSSTNDYTINIQNTWCESNNINFTPALFLNGRLFPSEYGIEDLGYFIEDLIDHQENQKQTEPIAVLV